MRAAVHPTADDSQMEHDPQNSMVYRRVSLPRASADADW